MAKLWEGGVVERPSIAQVVHVPNGDRGTGTRCTLQLCHVSSLAQRTGIPVVGNFRVADLVNGGQGAPLIPWVDVKLAS